MSATRDGARPRRRGDGTAISSRVARPHRPRASARPPRAATVVQPRLDTTELAPELRCVGARAGDLSRRARRGRFTTASTTPRPGPAPRSRLTASLRYELLAADSTARARALRVARPTRITAVRCSTARSSTSVSATRESESGDGGLVVMLGERAGSKRIAPGRDASDGQARPIIRLARSSGCSRLHRYQGTTRGADIEIVSAVVRALGADPDSIPDSQVHLRDVERWRTPIDSRDRRVGLECSPSFRLPASA